MKKKYSDKEKVAYKIGKVSKKAGGLQNVYKVMDSIYVDEKLEKSFKNGEKRF